MVKKETTNLISNRCFHLILFLFMDMFLFTYLANHPINHCSNYRYQLVINASMTDSFSLNAIEFVVNDFYDAIS